MEALGWIERGMPRAGREIERAENDWLRQNKKDGQVQKIKRRTGKKIFVCHEIKMLYVCFVDLKTKL